MDSFQKSALRRGVLRTARYETLKEKQPPGLVRFHMNEAEATIPKLGFFDMITQVRVELEDIPRQIGTLAATFFSTTYWRWVQNLRTIFFVMIDVFVSPWRHIRPWDGETAVFPRAQGIEQEKRKMSSKKAFLIWLVEVSLFLPVFCLVFLSDNQRRHEFSLNGMLFQTSVLLLEVVISLRILRWPGDNSAWSFLGVVATVSGVLFFCAKVPENPTIPFLLIGVGVVAVFSGFRTVLGWDDERHDGAQDDDEG